MRWLTERAPYRKHAQHANIPPLRVWKHSRPCGRIQQIESHHHHIPTLSSHCLLEHAMLRVIDKRLSDAYGAQFSFLSEAQQHWNKCRVGILVLLWSYAVQKVDVNIVSLQPSQALL